MSWQGDAYLGRLYGRLSTLLTKTARDIESDVKLAMADGKTGRFYDRPGGQIHIASAPGEAPAVDSGHLINTVYSKPAERVGRGLQAEAGATDENAANLELGTSTIEPRPAFRPAFDVRSRELRRALRR